MFIYSVSKTLLPFVSKKFVKSHKNVRPIG